MQEKKLFLLDGHALVYRAHFAFINRPLINSKGINTSAITGFVRTLWDLMRNQKPSHIAVFFDLDTPTFRHQMYEPYKANRESQPEDIQVAFPYIRKIVEGFNIPIVEMDGYEADDVIGTIAKQAEKEGFTVYMVTPDKDYAQLVSEHILLYKPSRQGNGIDILGVKEILESWEIERIDQVIDVLGLKGDAVDNIPGIPGVGEKTAVQLLKDYGSVEEVIAHADELKGKLKERVETYADQALLSKKLATIDLNAPVKFDAKAYEIEPVNREVLTEIFKELEFRTLAHAILGEEDKETQKDLFGNPVDSKVSEKLATPAPAYAVADKNAENTKHTYRLIDSLDGIRDLVQELEKQIMFCFDTETTGLDPNEAELVGLSLSWKDHDAYYIPFPEDQEAAREKIHLFKALFENPNIAKVGQNIKYDMLMLKWYGIEVKGALWDTMIAHYLMEPDQRHKLDNLSENYLNYKMIPIEDLIGKRGARQLSMRDVDKQKVKEYAAEDADITWQLYKVLFPKAKEEQVLQVYDSIESPLIQVLASMEYEGVKVDAKMLADYSVQLAKQIVEEERAIYKLAGVDFNIASPKQVGEVLFDKLRIPYRWRKTATGQYSTDEDKLSELALDFDIVAHIQDHRKLSKLKSTYVDALPNMINPRTGRIHTSYNQARAATGRLSSENPNLQNIPIRDEAGREIRKAFIPRDDRHILLSADYSQIELRLIADLSHEEAMLEAFEQNLDIHRATAARVYGVPIDEVTSDQRRNAKTVNFSIIYGAGSLNLSRQLGIKRAEASQLIDNYFKQYKGLKAYMEQTVAFARDHGYVKTLSGRRRILRDINSRNGLSRSNAERVAINTPIQGTAADMIKLAMIGIHEAFVQAGIQSKMILQVHDELVFDVIHSEMDQVKHIVEDKMKHALPNLKVPIEVGMGTGTNWLEAH
ncbi:MAG: DNA polymerase I [Saprospiraceae bacterium]|nr:DNA polymerase I [Saprospiraceae bacterium]MCB9321551.1 DNA polymerase I [Lewinellaceae bacterium]